MGDISENFSRVELACKCGCGQDTVDAELLAMMQDLRNAFGSIVVSSGNRCTEYNKQIGGADNSQHLRGRAADLHFTGVKLDDVAGYINEYYPETGMGVYGSFIHLDSRNYKARWNG